MAKRNTVRKSGKSVVSFDGDGTATAVAGPLLLLTVRETAALLKVSKSSLDKWRVFGGGPPYVRMTGGVVRYRMADLVAFCEARVRRSTSENCAAGRASA